MKTNSSVALLALISCTFAISQTGFGEYSFQIENQEKVEMSAIQTPIKVTASPLIIHPTWQILGPFPTGMREQDFGADPLEAFGGIRNIHYDPNARYPSELARGGLVSWDTTEMDSQNWVYVEYPEIEWSFNQQFMGWAINQYQAWAKSFFIVPSVAISGGDGLCSVTVQCENIGDFYIDNQRLSGDWYGYGLTRHTLRLAPNSRHSIHVRLVHEVRIFGGVILPPPSKFQCKVELVSTSSVEDTKTNHQHALVQVVNERFGGYIIMDVVDNILAGEYIGVTLRNVGPESVRVNSVRVNKGADSFSAHLPESTTSITIFPSTHRPIKIRLKKIQSDIQDLDFSLIFTLAIVNSGNTPSSDQTLETDKISIKHVKWGEPYMYTFLDFDDTVHHAAAIPPSNPSSQATSTAPVLVSLHGAGVEVYHNKFWITEYKQRERTWIVLPTGRSPWGYDWHGASIKNVFNAIQSLAENLPGVPKDIKEIPGIMLDTERLFIAGHSNGGQGAWYIATHFPDKAIGATPAAGYVNIKQYVPFNGWLSNSYTDPHLRGILESSIAEFDNDVHMSNTVGIPILARTGSADDNVPPINSRKMIRLGQENAHNLSAISLSEITGEGHWFTGALHDEIMQGFLKQILLDDLATTQTSPAPVYLPPFPKKFGISVINPSGMGPKGGIQVEQLLIAYRKGTIKVEVLEDPQSHPDDEASSTWILRTVNIRRLRFLDSVILQQRRGSISSLVIDGVNFNMSSWKDRSAGVSLGTFVRQANSQGGLHWQYNDSDEWLQSERHRETYGPAIQILEKRVVIVLGTNFSSTSTGLSETAIRIAKLVAHDIYLYGRGDVEVVKDKEYISRLTADAKVKERTNLVLIGDQIQNCVTKHVLQSTSKQEEVKIDSQGGIMSIYPESEKVAPSEFRDPGTGLLMIRPWGPSNLAMVIAGLDEDGLERAARLFPKRTGMVVPDWVVTGPEMGWKGAGGILAAGYWGNNWEYQGIMST